MPKSQHATPVTVDAKNALLRQALMGFPVLDLGPFSVAPAMMHQTASRPGFQTAWHAHPYAEVSQVRAGSMRYETQTGSVVARTSEWVFIPPQLVHRRSCPGRPALLEGFLLELRPRDERGERALETLTRRQGERRLRLMGEASIDGHFAVLDGEVAAKAFRVERTVRLLIDILQVLFRVNFSGLLEDPAPLPGLARLATNREKNLFAMADRFIRGRIGEGTNLSAISRHLGVGDRYVNLIFRRAAGRSCARYVSDLRMDLARELLASKRQLRIREVAERVGFADSYHFSRLFTKRFGRSPRAYRDLVSTPGQL